ncbi:AAA family ATPase [Kineococcus gynurae]|uniref:AAA family ATPase n=1 Tax=Kineococcus gynurae TaxID=452979 RepID=A0ABV5LRQ8_9ACTN
MRTGPARPLRRVEARDDGGLDVGSDGGDDWPASIPAVAHLLRHGWDVAAGVTFLVGENGSGKSTIVEALAQLLGAPEGGGTGAHRAGAERERAGDVSDLARRLRVVRGPGGRSREVFFLRAETMHAFVSYLARTVADPAAEEVGPHALHRISHGESFVEMLSGPWVRRAGVLLLDEPEAALSFANCLTLVGALHVMAREGKQVVCATHSPVLTALPGATILQLDDEGLTPVGWEDLRIVHDHRFFLDAPERYLRHVL